MKQLNEEKKKNEKSFESKNDREVNEFDGIEKSLEEEEKKNEKSFESKNEKKKNKEIEKNYIKVISKYKDSKMKNEEMEKKLENLKKEKEEEKKEYIKKERYKFFLFLSVIIVFFISVFYSLFFKKTDTIITIRLGSSSSEIYPGYETEEEDKSDSIPSEIVYDIKLKKGDLNLNFDKDNNNKLYFFKFDFSSPNETIKSDFPEDKEISSEIIIKEYLKLIKDKILEKKNNQKNIKWVLIIPYSWNENKQFIYSICKEIGMSKIKIILDYEVILNDKKNEINSKKGNILFIHLGRYKFEIILKEGKNNPKILKLFNYSSNEINEKILNIIKEEIGEEEFKNKNKYEIKSILDDIEEKKNTLDKSSEKTIPIKIPFKDDWQSSAFNHWIGNKKKMIYTREEIYFPSEDMKKMIKEVAEEIKNIIKGIKKEKKIEFLFLTGELSQSKIVQGILNNEFKNEIEYYKKIKILKDANKNQL